MPQIVFAARLTEADWDETLRGWRCPALAVPGAIVEALYVEGNKADTAKYEVLREHHVIRWTPSDQPQRVTASITLTEELTLGAETDRWKKLAIVLPVVATIASAGITATATYWPKTRQQTDSAIGPPKIISTIAQNELAPRPIENTIKDKALDLVLRQAVRGTTDQERWFKFSVTDKDEGVIRINVTNLYDTGPGVFLKVLNSNDVETAHQLCGSSCQVEYKSYGPDTYYLIIKRLFNDVMKYELVITKK
jgi:hypothetical protein